MERFPNPKKYLKIILFLLFPILLYGCAIPFYTLKNSSYQKVHLEVSNPPDSMIFVENMWQGRPITINYLMSKGEYNFRRNSNYRVTFYHPDYEIESFIMKSRTQINLIRGVYVVLSLYANPIGLIMDYASGGFKEFEEFKYIGMSYSLTPKIQKSIPSYCNSLINSNIKSCSLNSLSTFTNLVSSKPIETPLTEIQKMSDIKPINKMQSIQEIDLAGKERAVDIDESNREIYYALSDYLGYFYNKLKDKESDSNLLFRDTKSRGVIINIIKILTPIGFFI